MPHISKAQIRTLREVLDRMEMRNVDFGSDRVTLSQNTGYGGGHGNSGVVMREGLMPIGGGEKSATEFIVQRTKLWRETWIIHQLRNVLESLEEKK